jgi:hypothetical protein
MEKLLLEKAILMNILDKLMELCNIELKDQILND